MIIVVLTILIIVYITKKYMRDTLWIPVKGRITSKFGYRIHPITGVKGSYHNGTDIAAPTGTPIIAPMAGKVTSMYTHDKGGVTLIAHHINGWRTGYAHLDRYAEGLKRGDEFGQGDVIGYVGNTGASTGPHLHFTLTDPNGTKQDPELFFGKELVHSV